MSFTVRQVPHHPTTLIKKQRQRERDAQERAFFPNVHVSYKSATRFMVLFSHCLDYKSRLTELQLLPLQTFLAVARSCLLLIYVISKVKKPVVSQKYVSKCYAHNSPSTGVFEGIT